MYKILSDRCRYSLAIGCIAILLVGLSCKGKTAEPSALVSKTSATEQVLTVADSLSKLDYLRNFKTRQVGERKFVIQPGDTIDLPKPMLKLFTGKVEGKQVQFWLCTDYDNSDAVVWYMEDDDDLTISGYNIKGDRLNFTVKRGSNNYNVSHNLNTDLATVVFNDRSYRIAQDAVRFVPYQKFMYYNTICTEYLSLFRHSSYNFDYTIDKVNSDRDSYLYTQLKEIHKNDSLIVATDIFDITPQPLDSAISDPNGPCLRWGFTETVQPVYIDSLLYVIRSFMEEDNGGAHGWYAINYTNIDIETLKYIEYTDVVDTENLLYIDFLAQSIKKQSAEYEYNTDAEYIEDISSFYIVPGGIKIFYPNYSLGGGFWHKEFFLPYDEIKPFLKTDKYFRR